MLNIPLLKIDTDKLLNQISQENQTIPKVEIQYPAPRKTLCDVIKDFPKQNKEVSELLKEKNETKMFYQKVEFHFSKKQLYEL